MARILLITDKHANTGAYQQGLCSKDDLVGVFEDGHEFSPLEIAHFKIVDVHGFTKQELKDELDKKIPKIKEIVEINGEWYEGDLVTLNKFNPTRIKEAFIDNDEWFLLEKRRKHPLSLSDLSSNDIAELASKSTTKDHKKSILDKIKCKHNIYQENKTKIDKIK